MTEIAQPANPEDCADKTPPASAGRSMSVGRVVFACAECHDVVSWPVAPERRRKQAAPTPPEPGRYRTVQGPDGSVVFVLPTAGARVSGGRALKMARTCNNGHYVGDLRDDPHPGPWQFEIPATNVVRRRLRVD